MAGAGWKLCESTSSWQLVTRKGSPLGPALASESALEMICLGDPSFRGLAVERFPKVSGKPAQFGPQGKPPT